MSPSVYVIAGPNGAGKTTFAQTFLPRYAVCKNFVNADLIAMGLAPFSPEAGAFRAGRLVLDQIRRFSLQRADFAFETTLSGITYLKLLRRLRIQGYAVHIFFLWLPDVGLALSRIRDRVREGGHDVPEVVVRRRFGRSLKNFLGVYRDEADAWVLFDNSASAPSMIAFRKRGKQVMINTKLYETIVKRYGPI
jgi:predicted ABC-type ATPase